MASGASRRGVLAPAWVALGGVLAALVLLGAGRPGHDVPPSEPSPAPPPSELAQETEGREQDEPGVPPPQPVGPDCGAAGCGEPSEAAGPPRPPCWAWLSSGRFMISAYSVPIASRGEDARSMADLAEAGWTHAGPWYDTYPTAEVAEAVAAGLCVVHHLGTPGVRSAEAAGGADAWLAEVDELLRRVLADPLVEPHVSAWALLPEEMDANKDDQAQLLRRVSALVREADPRGRPLYMYLAGGSDDVELAAAAQALDVLGRGQYLVGSGLARERIALRASMERLTDARDRSHEADFVVPVLEHGISTDRTVEPGDEWLIERWVTHDVLTSVANGADGFFTYSHAPRGRPEVFDAYAEAYARIVALLRTSGLLHALGGPGAAVPVEVLAGPSEQPTVVLYAAGDRTERFPTVSTRRWRDGGTTLIVATNSAAEPVEAELAGLPVGGYLDLLTGDRFEVRSDRSLTLDLDAWQSVLLTLR